MRVNFGVKRIFQGLGRVKGQSVNSKGLMVLKRKGSARVFDPCGKGFFTCGKGLVKRQGFSTLAARVRQGFFYLRQGFAAKFAARVFYLRQGFGKGF
jgi:hypothetical protein